ncbi:proline-rich protein 36-like [Gorilla gorilla gorilla]|uniref:proline-rich protein 36-like n=1 Tax=Gorilla gorilla gorilla TaxID=9595 RepID=UPI00300AD0EF
MIFLPAYEGLLHQGKKELSQKASVWWGPKESTTTWLKGQAPKDIKQGGDFIQSFICYRDLQPNPGSARRTPRRGHSRAALRPAPGPTSRPPTESSRLRLQRAASEAKATPRRAVSGFTFIWGRGKGADARLEGRSAALHRGAEAGSAGGPSPFRCAPPPPPPPRATPTRRATRAASPPAPRSRVLPRPGHGARPSPPPTYLWLPPRRSPGRELPLPPPRSCTPPALRPLPEAMSSWVLAGGRFHRLVAALSTHLLPIDLDRRRPCPLGRRNEE